MKDGVDMRPPAIVAVGYNRPKSLKRLLDSLSKAVYDGESVPLVISIDKADNKDVERIAQEYRWPFGPKRTILQPTRLGLRRHILQCGSHTEELGAIVLLEDDLYVSPMFYRFARQALAAYGDHPRIGGISLYAHAWNVVCSRPFVPEDDGTDSYFLQFAQSWGQVWNRRMWADFAAWYHEHELKDYTFPGIPERVRNWPASSWLKYQIACIVETGRFFVYPRTSHTTNFGDTGQHASSSSSAFQVPLLEGEKRRFVFPSFSPDAVIYDVFFERCGLGRRLGTPDEDLCVDLYGTKGNRQGRRYWLTMERRHFRTIAAFQLGMRPHEMGVIHGIGGTDIFLYDTAAADAAPSGQRLAWSSPAATRVLYDIRALSRAAALYAAWHHLSGAVMRKLQRWSGLLSVPRRRA